MHLEKNPQSLYSKSMKAPVFPSVGGKERLLLPHFPQLVFVKKEPGFVLEKIPDWLALKFTTGTENLAGKDIRFFERFIPGLIELVENVSRNKQPVKGYQTWLSSPDSAEIPKSLPSLEIGMDKGFEKSGSRRLVLDAFPVSFPDGKDGVSITIQDIGRQLIEDGIDFRKAVFAGLIGKSEPMLRVFNKIRLYGVVDSPVVIIGETGAGKEGIAKALHEYSPRRDNAFVPVNCSAISESLFESELFGHEKGSFTGAIKSHKGRFERADGGTLFLDEIGDLPLSSQTKLLRVLEEETVERVGSEVPVKVDVRVIAATNKNLEEEISKTRFRADLFYRINALQIFAPPLRERQEDIPLLVNYFVENLNKKYQRDVRRLSPEALRLLQQYKWPGNVRELRNLLERLFAENQTQVIGLSALREWYEERINAAKYSAYDPRITNLPYRKAIPLGMSPPEALAWGLPPGWGPEELRLPGDNGPVPLDSESLKRAFQAAGGNITRAASLLGIHKATLYRHMKLLKLDRKKLSE